MSFKASLVRKFSSTMQNGAMFAFLVSEETALFADKRILTMLFSFCAILRASVRRYSVDFRSVAMKYFLTSSNADSFLNSFATECAIARKTFLVFYDGQNKFKKVPKRRYFDQFLSHIRKSPQNSPSSRLSNERFDHDHHELFSKRLATCLFLHHRLAVFIPLSQAPLAFSSLKV